MNTTQTVITPQGSFTAEWPADANEPPRYSGDAEAIAYFKDFLALNVVSGRDGALLTMEKMEPADLVGFCQSDKYGIAVFADFDDMNQDSNEPMTTILDDVNGRSALIEEGHALVEKLSISAPDFYVRIGRLREIVASIDAADNLDRDEGGDAIPDGRENVVKTAKGNKVVTGFKVVEASRLIVSHDSDGNENPDYPMELQPRDRARATSIAWVKKTAANLDPESLGRTTRADTGAPIIGKDYVVESGNGRTMAIIEAYRTGTADEYRNWLIEEADYFKVSADRIRSMKRPVLVRVRTSEIDRRAFAVEANQDDKLAMTATEKARADSKRLSDDLIARMGESGDLLAAENNAFLAGFLQSLGDAEAAQYITSNGKPTASLVARVQAAIFSKAYNDDRLLELTADSAKPEIANVISALNAAAPTFIRAMDANRIGTEETAEKLVDSVELSLNKQAVDAVIGAINVVKSARDNGMDVSEYVRQQGLFGDTDPNVAAMAVFIATNNRSAKRLGTAFRAMAEYIRSEGEHSQTGDMFGGSAPVSLSDVIGAANRALDKEFGEGEFAIGTPGLFDESQPVPVVPPAAPVAEPAQHSEEFERFRKWILEGGTLNREQITTNANFNDGEADELLALMDSRKEAAAADPMAAARDVIAGSEFKSLTKDFTSSLATIKGIDEGTVRGYDRALFVNSITGKMKTRAANNPMLASVLLAWLYEVQSSWKKPAVTLRNGIWGLTDDWEQYRELFRAAPAADPVPPTPDNKEPAVQPATNPDAALMQSVINGTADMMGEALPNELEAAYERIKDDPAMMAMFEQAARAYSDYMVAAAKAALG